MMTIVGGTGPRSVGTTGMKPAIVFAAGNARLADFVAATDVCGISSAPVGTVLEFTGSVNAAATARSFRATRFSVANNSVADWHVAEETAAGAAQHTLGTALIVD